MVTMVKSRQKQLNNVKKYPSPRLRDGVRVGVARQMVSAPCACFTICAVRFTRYALTFYFKSCTFRGPRPAACPCPARGFTSRPTFKII